MSKPTVYSIQRQLAKHIKECGKNQIDIMVRLRWMEKILYGTMLAAIMSSIASHFITSYLVK